MASLASSDEFSFIGENINKKSKEDIRKAASEALKDLEDNAALDAKRRQQHFLMIGRSGTGKTSLCGVLIDGESAEGTSGPAPGNLQLITTTTEKRGNVTYHIHDTRGIGDDKVDLNEMKDAVKQVYRNNDCLVIVCIKYDERLVDYNSKLPLEVCNELSDDVWSKAIIAITNSDKLSPKVLSLQPTDRNAKISKAKKEWEEQIHETLSKLKKGSLGGIQNVKICFTGYTGIFCQVEEHWEDKLFKAIIEIAPNFKGAANYIILQCLFEGHGSTSCSSNLSVNRLVDPSTNPPHHTIPVFKILKEVAESGEYIGNKIGSHAGTAAFIAASGEWKTASGAERFGRSVGSSFGSFLLTGAAGLLIWLYIQKNFDI